MNQKHRGHLLWVSYNEMHILNFTLRGEINPLSYSSPQLGWGFSAARMQKSPHPKKHLRGTYCKLKETLTWNYKMISKIKIVKMSHFTHTHSSGKLSKQFLESVTDVIFINVNLDMTKYACLSFLVKNQSSKTYTSRVMIYLLNMAVHTIIYLSKNSETSYLDIEWL